MVKVSLTFPTPEGSQEIPLDGERLSLGRGSEAGYRFSDDGLSRLHATLYCDGNRVWIVDENSSNGTFVNGSPVRPGGTPLLPRPLSACLGTPLGGGPTGARDELS